MQKITFQDATVVKAPYVEINGIEYPVIFETEGGTDLDAETFNDLQDNVEEAIIDDYEDLSNKPQINNVELLGNKSLDDLGIASKVMFSTNEIDTGKIWIDGKHIYRKVFVVSGSTTTFAHGITSLGDITDYGGTILRNEVVDGETIQTPFPALNSDSRFSLFFNYVTVENVALVKGTGINANTIKLWIEYTKSN